MTTRRKQRSPELYMPLLCLAEAILSLLILTMYIVFVGRHDEPMSLQNVRLPLPSYTVVCAFVPLCAVGGRIVYETFIACRLRNRPDTDAQIKDHGSSVVATSLILILTYAINVCVVLIHKKREMTRNHYIAILLFFILMVLNMVLCIMGVGQIAQFHRRRSLDAARRAPANVLEESIEEAKQVDAIAATVMGNASPIKPSSPGKGSLRSSAAPVYAAQPRQQENAAALDDITLELAL